MVKLQNVHIHLTCRSTAMSIKKGDDRKKKKSIKKGEAVQSSYNRDIT